MNLKELIAKVQKEQSVSYSDMVENARAQGFSNFSKATISRAVNQPLAEFPARNVPAFAAALGVTVYEVMCACAESIWPGEFEFHLDNEGRSVVVVTAGSGTTAGDRDRVVYLTHQRLASPKERLTPIGRLLRRTAARAGDATYGDEGG